MLMPELSRLHDQNNAHLIHTQTCKPTRLHTRTRIYKFNMSGFFFNTITLHNLLAFVD